MQRDPGGPRAPGDGGCHVDEQVRGERTFVGRVAERRHIEDVLTGVAAGRGAVVVVRGEPGVGKSRLVAECLARARTAGLSVLHGDAQPGEQTRPFGVAVDMLRISSGSEHRLLRECARILRRGSTWADADDEVPVEVHAVVELVVEHLENVHLPRPTAVVVEDLHWADGATLTLMRRLARLVSQYPLAVVTTTRASDRLDVETFLTAATRSGATVTELDRLDETDVLRLAGALLRATPGERLAHALRRADGNPLFVVELLRSLQARHLVAEVDGHVDLLADEPDAALDATILHRLRVLPAGTADLLRHAAVLGPSFTVEELAHAVGASPVDLIAPVRAVIAVGVLDSDEHGLRFQHDLVRDALYRSWPDTLRRLLHREAADGMRRRGVPDFRIVPHVMAGAEHGDQEAAAWLHRVGRESATRDPDAGAQVLARALELCPEGDEGRDRMRFDLAVATSWSGRPVEADQLARAVVSETTDSDLRGRAAYWLGTELLRRGRAQDAARLVEAALAAGVDSRRERTRLSTVVALGSLLRGDDVALESLEEAVADARALDDPQTLGRCLVATAIATGYRGDLERSERAGLEAVALAETLPAVEVLSTAAHLSVATWAQLEMDVATALGTVERALHLVEQLPRSTAVVGYDIARAHCLFHLGHWDDALVELDSATAWAQDSGRETWVLALALRAVIGAHRDQLTAARTDVDHALAAAAGGASVWHPAMLAHARALVEEYEGAPRRAYASAAGAWQMLLAAGSPHGLAQVGAHLARLRAAGHAPGDDPAGSVTVLDDLAGRSPRARNAAASVALVRGLSAWDPERLDAAADLFHSAGRVLDAAWAREDAAVAWARAGDLARARDRLVAAVTTYGDLGAVRRTATAVARLRAVGVRLGPRGVRPPRPSRGPGSLTDAERAVVALVADRLTNAEIAERLVVSRRTVETHVSNSLRKLSCTTRRDLASAVRGPAPGGTGSR